MKFEALFYIGGVGVDPNPVRIPVVALDILVVKGEKILLGLLSEAWAENGKRVYGLPGREVRFGERIEDCIRANVAEVTGITLPEHEVEIFGVNPNRHQGNHFINISVLVHVPEGTETTKTTVDWESWQWVTLDQVPDNLFITVKYTLESYRKKKMIVSE